MNQNLQSNEDAFVFKGSLLPLTVLQVKSIDLTQWMKQLTQLSRKAPDLFKQMPVVLDFSQWKNPSAAIDFLALKQCLAEFQWILVGVRALSPVLQPALKPAGIALMTGAKPTSFEPVPAVPQPVEEQTSSKTVTPTLTKFIDKPVRSGQQVYARGADLIVMAPVSHGAELLADGHIHVYGPLRGRALAGINGDTKARIFCQSMEAELIAIADAI